MLQNIHFDPLRRQYCQVKLRGLECGKRIVAYLPTSPLCCISRRAAFYPVFYSSCQLIAAMHPVRKATLAVCIILPIVATISVYFRFAARRVRKLPLLVDDWTALMSLVGPSMIISDISCLFPLGIDSRFQYCDLLCREGRRIGSRTQRAPPSGYSPSVQGLWSPTRKGFLMIC